MKTIAKAQKINQNYDNWDLDHIQTTAPSLLNRLSFLIHHKKIIHKKWLSESIKSVLQ